MANTLNLFRNGAVGFIGWLGAMTSVTVGFHDQYSPAGDRPAVALESRAHHSELVIRCRSDFALDNERR